jgi:hypothetical protein
MPRLIPTRAWRDYSDWHQSRKLRALPANAWTLSAYIRAYEPKIIPEAIQNGVEAISRHHLFRCARSPDRHPMVQNALQTLRQNADLNGSQPALFDAGQFMSLEPAKTRREAPKENIKHKRVQMRGQPKLVSRRPSGP